MKRFLSAALLLSCLCATAVAAEKPNIVLLFVDDLGWNSLGYRNPELFETPNIDQLASDGIDFQQCYVASPTCSPSRSTLLTGKHPARLKMVRHITDKPKGVKFIYDDQGRATHHLLINDPAQFPSKNWVDLEQVTYAEALKSHGYYNLFLGKWHLGPKEFHPIHQGFDRQIGTTDHGSPSNYYPDYFKDEDVLQEETEAYLTDKLTDETVEFIDGYSKDQPFMISLWYYNVHTPNIGRKDLVPRFEGREGLEGKRAQYAAQVGAVDESVGRVRAALKAKGIDQNTIIIFTSDQGSLYEWEPYRGGKRVDTLCEGGARVPFVVSWPGVTKSGTTNDSIIQTTDVFPTLVELVGGNPADDEDLDGVSLLSTIRENSELQRDKPIYGYRAYEDLYVSVREGDWKLLGYRSGKTSLYNVVEDRSEKHDVAAEHPEIVSQLVKKLKAWEQKMEVEQYSGVQ
ncbi:Arylsulfatase A [Neorhodopirellula lusitana]|uniref:Arylsulfatase A n=1 Tax=Neorhodopirellula lusitana TaxID=445327 RepID=A0ABY1PQV0_9BACT|nr:sulfatase [Neorhodopirellula lusitana]SMP43023.1 Arylsulfatase A [Neorhodopirellula lusitana]